eukprot:scaffold118490_cov31-Tisochrysis_lutea.AAC.1
MPTSASLKRSISPSVTSHRLETTAGKSALEGALRALQIAARIEDVVGGGGRCSPAFLSGSSRATIDKGGARQPTNGVIG